MFGLQETRVEKENALLPQSKNIILINRENEKVETLPSLICGTFQEPLWIGFGCVTVGTKYSRRFQIINPESSEVIISIHNCPSNKGFSIELGDSQSTLRIPGNHTSFGSIHWIPSINMSVREVATLMMNSKIPLQVTIHGFAGSGEVRVHYPQ
jgi:hypothetical protein